MTSLALPIAATESEQRLIADIQQYGWHFIEIPEDDIGPGYLFTVGLYYSYSHPEILLMGLDSEISRAFLQSIAGGIKTGAKYLDGSMDSDLASFPIAFKGIALSRYHDYLGYANWLYRAAPNGFPAVQFIWPDKAGKFPWDKGYNSKFLARQTPLWLD